MVGLMVEVACGAIVYVAVNLMMKNAFMIEILEKVKVKLLHRA